MDASLLRPKVRQSRISIQESSHTTPTRSRRLAALATMVQRTQVKGIQGFDIRNGHYGFGQVEETACLAAWTPRAKPQRQRKMPRPYLDTNISKIKSNESYFKLPGPHR